MNWYLAKIVFRIICGDGQHAAQFDEELRLIAANDPAEAFEKACSLGKNEEDRFYNQNKQLVHWQFINVSELYGLAEMVDGAEVCSRIKEIKNAEAYTNFVHQRANFLQEQASKNQLQNLI